MKNLFKLTGFILFSLFLASFTSHQDEKQSYILMKDGKKIILNRSVTIDAEDVNYEDENGKKRSVKQKNIEKMAIGDRLFINLPITSNMTRLQEVIAHNDSYLLTSYWQTIDYFYVYDKDMKPVVKKYKVLHKKKSYQKAYEEIALVYFKKCDGLLEAMKSNIDNDMPLHKEIYNYQCGKRTFE